MMYNKVATEMKTWKSIRSVRKDIKYYTFWLYSMINRDICKFVYVFDKLSFLEKKYQIGLD